MEDIQKAKKENQNLLNISLNHHPTKNKLLLGRDLATQFPQAFFLIKDIHIIDWLILERKDLISKLNKSELEYLLREINRFKSWLWNKGENHG